MCGHKARSHLFSLSSGKRAAPGSDPQSPTNARVSVLLGRIHLACIDRLSELKSRKPSVVSAFAQ